MKEYPHIPLDYTAQPFIRYLVETEKANPGKLKRTVLDKRWNLQLMKFRAICILRYKLTHA